MKFESLEHAFMTLEEAIANGDINCDAMAYLLENGPPELKAMMDRKFSELFPELKATHVDDRGNQYFDIETVAESLGMSREEAMEAAEDLPEGCVRRSEKGLHRIH